MASMEICYRGWGATGMFLLYRGGENWCNYFGKQLGILW